MSNRLTQKQETFCLKYFELGNATEAALIAGYSPKTADVIASENLEKPRIIDRIQELRQKVEDASVATVLERKQVLTEIVRGRLTDFMECGQDGSWVNIDSDKMNTHAILGIDSKTEYDENGSHPTVVTKIRLHNPIQAIAELNKMERIYDSEGSTTINNQINNVTVASEQDKKNVERVMSGERT